MQIQYEGRSYEIPDRDLGNYQHRTDQELKARLAFFLDVWPRLLDDCVILRLPDGTLVLSPSP